ncbi:MFS transporter [Mesorhizobium sp. M8A.F.Ca.ET.173.01.1.1]|nr:MFS transporter [Mesorhizobium sp. M8A.F.Ca.ET.173.01.1.1]
MTFLAKWPGPITIISIAQLFGTSLWFSANGATVELMTLWHVTAEQIGWLTSAVQGGFIIGTLFLSLTGIADRYKASHIFALCAVFGALLNLMFAMIADGIWIGILFRFLVGLTLAGIYPLGMKMIVKWAPDRAGWGLSTLVAMLTLGTALPHGLRAYAATYPWYTIVGASSVLSFIGAILILALGEGSHEVGGKPNDHTNAISGLTLAFARPAFRRAAFGYFGHMWELYAFWTIVPLLVARTVTEDSACIAAVSFVTISAGAAGCIAGGFLSRIHSGLWVAASSLAVSGICCLVFASFWQWMSPVVAFSLLLVWGATVVADSPQFSAMSAKACPPELVGSALAIQNAIGFAITMVSILLVTKTFGVIGPATTSFLAVGPLLGLIGLLRRVPVQN